MLLEEMEDLMEGTRWWNVGLLVPMVTQSCPQLAAQDTCSLPSGTCTFPRAAFVFKQSP